MTIIESVRDYISKLNCIKTFDSILNVNFLNSEEDSFSIEEIPTEIIIKKYADGSSVRKFDFIFCSREPYGVEVIQNIENSKFYELLTNEIEENNDKEELPELGEGYESLSIEVTSSSYLATVNEDTAMYQINLRLRYIKQKRSDF